MGSRGVAYNGCHPSVIKLTDTLPYFQHARTIGFWCGRAGRSFGGTIAERLGIAAAKLSFHRKQVANAGMVEARQDGWFVFYSANCDQMNGLLGYLTENWCQGEGFAAECAP
jgi:hypothetical protein